MIFNIVKKQGIVLFRNRHQLFLLILLPIILITILSISLSSFFSSDLTPINLKVAIIEHEDEGEQIDRFLSDNKTIPMFESEEVAEQIKQFTPVKILTEDVFGSLTDIVVVETVSAKNKDKVLNDESYTTVIEVPNEFTYSMLNRLFLDVEHIKSLIIYENNEDRQGVAIVKQIINEYKEQLTFTSLVGKHNLNIDDFNDMTERVKGNITSIDDVQPINSKQYYTVGMAVMNVLFIASAIGTYAYEEKKINVFDRIVMANIRGWTYFSGILISGTLFAFIQLIILFAFSRLFFGVSIGHIGSFLLVTLALATTVGGISVLLTSISYRLNSEVLTNTFQIVVISLCAFLGGSFFPIGDLSQHIQVIGNLTPNGAGLTAYLNILRGNGLSSVTKEVIYLFVLSFVLIVIAVISYPKRRVAK